MCAVDYQSGELSLPCHQRLILVPHAQTWLFGACSFQGSVSASLRISSSGMHSYRLWKVAINSPAATSMCSAHLREAEESGCSGSTRYGSNLIAGMSNCH